MIEPVLHRIVVKLVSLEEYDKETAARASKIEGFVVVHGDEQTKRRASRGVDEGTVISLGPTVFVDFKTDCPIKVGDKITFAKGAAKLVTDPEDNQEYAVINDEDVVAILK